MSQPKKKAKLEDEILDLPVDREQGLANSFEDLSLAEVLPIDSASAKTSEGAPQSVAEEAVEALEELVFDLSAGESNAQTSPEPAGKAFELDVGQALLEASSQVEAFAPQASADTEEHFKFEPLVPQQTEEKVEESFFSDPSPNIKGADESGEEAFVLDGQVSNANQTIQLMGERLFSFVACETPFEQMVEEILVILMKATSAQAGSILELDYNKQEFFFRATLGGGDPEIVKTFRVPADKGIVGHVAESKQILLLKDLGSDEKQLKAISMSTGFETRTCLAAPIMIANQIYGVVELFNKLPNDCFDEEDKEILERGLKMVGKVLEVRFLLSELSKRAG